MNQVVGLSVWPGFSIPDETSNQAPHPITVFGDQKDVRFPQEARLNADKHLRLELRQRAPGDVQKLQGILIRPLGVTLGDIRRHRNRRTSQLMDNVGIKPCTVSSAHQIDRDRKIAGLRPCRQPSIIWTQRLFLHPDIEAFSPTPASRQSPQSSLKQTPPKDLLFNSVLNSVLHPVLNSAL